MNNLLKYLTIAFGGGSLVLGVLVSFFLLGAYYEEMTGESSQTSPQTVTKQVISYYQDPELVGLLNSVGIQPKNEYHIVYKNHQGDIIGEFDGFKTISVSPHIVEQKLETVVHEYLHAIYNPLKVSQADKDYLKANPVVAERLALYTNCDGACMSNEAIAFGCTLLYDNELTPNLVQYCNKHIPNRQPLLNQFR